MNECDAVLGTLSNQTEQLPVLLDEEYVANYFGVGTQTLANWRLNNTGGPTYIKLGKKVVYKLQDIIDFLDKSTVHQGIEAGK